MIQHGSSLAFGRVWILLVLVSVTVGCESTTPTLSPTPETIQNPTSTHVPFDWTPTPAPSMTHTPVVDIGESSQELTLSIEVDLPTPAPDPLRFIFPTAQVAPVSAWRPPLYPVPWAPTLHDHFYFSRPIAADQVNWPLQNYRYGGEFFQDVVHTGVDIPAPQGIPVLSAGSGKVIWAGYGVYRGGFDTTDPYGLAVTIRHDFGYQGQALYTVYGHLDQVDVAVGQFVETGEILGLVGETGRVTGPHLHFEIRIGENDFFSTRNPELWVVPPIGWGVLAGQILDSSAQPVEAQPVVLTSLTTGQNWFSRSYGAASPANADPFYQENMVIGDLPAGRYRIRIAYAGTAYDEEVEVFPGQVSYFYFYGKGGIVIGDPPEPEIVVFDETEVDSFP